jgi:hypothetical protein
MRPRWRWWLFCAAVELDVRFGWAWARRLWSWSIPADAFGDGAANGDVVAF